MDRSARTATAKESRPVPSAPDSPAAFADRFLTQDPATREILCLLAQVAPTDVPILIAGETGTGKDLLATALHDASARRRGPFVAVNCGAIVPSLAESEIFGHEAGAFTGASRPRPGRFELAHGGTIFLDEIGEMRRHLQVHLLRILQSGEYTPVGATAARVCDVRVISATNRDLGGMVGRGTFRSDLYHRLNIIGVTIPPLRDRRGDIGLLAQHFLARYATRYGKAGLTAEPSFYAALEARTFPGNARELENLVHRAIIVCRGDRVGVRHLPAAAEDGRPAAAGEMPFHAAKARAIERFERLYLTTVLVRSGGVISRAARDCGLSERNFHAKLKAYGISSKGIG